MHPYFKYLLLLSLLINFTNAQERFVDEDAFHLAHNTLSEKYCKAFKAEKRFCKAKKLTYIDANVTDLPAFLKGLGAYITPILKEYKENDLKNDVLSTIKEFNGDVTGEWYDETAIALFSKTPSTYTLSNTSNGYSGGAHGYYRITFGNYDIQTQKKLTLEALFIADSNKTLHTIALNYYRQTRGLKPTESLVDDGWFENRFMLAENFAITPRGIYFLYNQYEIKSYADGLTEFLLPYSALHNIINPRGVLAFALQQPKHQLHADFDSEQIKLSIDAKKNNDATVTVTARMTSREYAKQGWLSVSLPQISSKKGLLSTGYTHFDHVTPYDSHNRIYNGTLKKTIPAKYLLIKADKRNMGYGKTYTMTFKIKIPKKLKTLIIDIRGTLKTERMTYVLPDEYEGVEGQQGYTNYRVFLGL